MKYDNFLKDEKHIRKIQIECTDAELNKTNAYEYAINRNQLMTP